MAPSTLAATLTDQTTDASQERLEIVGAPKHLNHLPVVVACIKRLGLAKAIDERVAAHPQRELTTGSCVEALVLAVLSGTHTLYRVGETLEPFDIATMLDAPFDPARVTDNRLGRALDMLFGAGLSGVNAAVLLRAIEVYELDVSTVHFDTTSVSVHGQYPGSVAGDAENPDGAPHVTHGYNKDHRPDLKQVVYGLSVTSDGYVPLLGRVTDGNRSDSLETRFNLTRLVDVLPDPASTLLVADSKQFSGETFVTANRNGVKLLCPLPVNTDAWSDAYGKAEAVGEITSAPILREKAIVRGTAVDDDGNEFDLGEEEQARKHVWRGRSVNVEHRWTEETDDGKVEHRIPLKALVVWSSQLAEKKRRTLTRRTEKEKLALEKLGRKLTKADFHCEEDARAAALDALTKLEKFHTAEVTVARVTKRLKRKRPGRPKKGEEVPTKEVCKVEVTFVFDQAKFDERLERASCFALVTQPEATQDDAALLEVYKGQAGAEMAFKWTKGPAQIAPIFLETPSRIAALGLVYVFALMVHALVQRTLRQRLQQNEATIPGNRGRTAKPTGEVLYRLLENIVAVPVRTFEGVPKILIPEITTEQVAAFELLGVDLLQRADVIARVHAPRRGQRGYKGKGPFGRPRSKTPKKPRRRRRGRDAER